MATGDGEDGAGAGADGGAGVSGYRIINGDGLEVAHSLSDASVDALITDPPYCSGAVSESSRTRVKGQGIRSENRQRFGWFVGDNMGTAGLAWLLRAIAFEATRFLKPTGHALVFMDWRMVPNLIPAIESAGLRYQNLIAWDKGSMGLGLGFRAQHELIAHFTNGSPAYHDAGTGNVIRCSRVTRADRRHQTEKPTALLAALMRVVVPPGGVVFDPFAGSGTTAEAARDLGLDAILAERDGEMVQDAQEALAARQPMLALRPEGEP